MLILPQTNIVTWNSRNIKHYVELGYIFTKRGDTFEVNFRDLTIGSTAKIRLTCDYCGEEITMQYHTFVMLQRKFKNILLKDCCSKAGCVNQKIKEVNMIKYGVEYLKQDSSYQQSLEDKLFKEYGVTNVFQLESVKQKSVETCRDKYGKDNYSQTKEGKEQYKQTCQEKYNCDNTFQVEEFKDKSKETCLTKYNKEYYTQTDEYKERARQTCMEIYGTPNPLQNKDIRQKCIDTLMAHYGVDNPTKNKEISDRAIKNAMKTMSKNGTARVSTQQVYLHSLLGGELNFYTKKSLLDIAFFLNKIYIEYDGSGHKLQVMRGLITEEEFDLKEMRRWYALHNDGWKEIRIISKQDYLPLDNKIIEIINYAYQYLDSGHSWIHFDIDNQLIKGNKYERYYDFGELRKIKKEDVIENDINMVVNNV